MSKSKDRSFEWEYWETERDVHGVTENAVFPDEVDKENYQPRTLVDQTLEVIDPTPNVYTLFIQFNEKFFWNELLPVQVKWSPRMTTCAGICTFHPRNRECIISLSAPLLKLRPRKDLVETLLHEMIHGYLFLTNNNRDRDGHGPEFCKHMKRINKLAGTNITIYHSFHDEVRLYKQHWWRCNGPCQKKAPFFGTVRRAMNRAPGPNDFWWESHKQKCDGQFIKIKEPEKNQKSKPKKESKSSTVGMKKIDQYVSTTPKSMGGIKNKDDSKIVPSGLVKLGTATNRVHGFGTGGPGSVKSSTVTSQTTKSQDSPPTFSCSGKLGGGGSGGRSNLLDKFLSPQNSSKKISSPKTTASVSSITSNPPNRIKTSAVSKISPKKVTTTGSSISLITPPKKKQKLDENLQNCPVCNIGILPELMNNHLDDCLLQGEKAGPSGTNRLISPKSQTTMEGFLTKTTKSHKKTEKEKSTICNICNSSVTVSKLYDHLNVCLKEPEPLSIPKVHLNNFLKEPEPPLIPEVIVKEIVIDSDDEIPQKKLIQKDEDEKFYLCLVCNDFISKDIPLDVHLETCVSVCFGDSDDEMSFVESPLPKEDAKFPCPVCTELIVENLMNSHLDECIK